MYILNILKFSLVCHLKVTKCKICGPFIKTPTEMAELPQMPPCQAGLEEKAKKSKELTNSAQKAMVLAIIPHVKDGVPERGILKKFLRCLACIK